MFNLFKKPIGIYLSDKSIVLVQLEKEKKKRVLKTVHREDLPEGTIIMGSIQDPKALIAALIKMREKVQGQECAVSLPIAKCYSAVVDFPAEMQDDLMLKVLQEKATSILPVSLAELQHEDTILRGVKNDKNLAFLSGFERQVLQQYRAAFEAAGWKKTSFVLETLALERAIPVKLSEYPAVMFLHSFGDKHMISSVYHGRAFDGIVSFDIQRDFLISYNAYIQQIGVAPTHIIVSGDQASLDPLAAINFGRNKPDFISAEFEVTLEGEKQNEHDLIIATGLALGKKSSEKNGGLSLLNLLE